MKFSSRFVATGYDTNVSTEYRSYTALRARTGVVLGSTQIHRPAGQFCDSSRFRAANRRGDFLIGK